jgi:DNA helicase-2/ATP-dependent DNA helicase PcrA
MSLHHQLNPAQCEAVDTLSGPLLVLAGAGSGKTRVVTCRIANLISKGVPPSAILGLTFTNKAAGEMKERVAKMCNHAVLVCTFHSLGARILRESIHAFGYRRDFTIYDEQDAEKLVKVCIEDLQPNQKIDPKRMLQLISKAKNGMQGPADIQLSGLDAADRLFPNVYECYQNKLKEFNAVDFDDLLYLPVRLFSDCPEILKIYQERWSHLLVDEFQDTNASQYAMVRFLSSHRNNICVVGDPDQSIYSWRGANVSNILGFKKDFPEAKVISLQQNYRSRTNILEASNELISNNSGRFEKHLWSERGPGEKIKYYTADTEKSEAAFVAEKIRYYYDQKNIPLKEMAVFYRTNAQSRALEDRLLMHHIPYVIVGGISFYQRREIKDVLAFLRMIQSGADYISFSRTINLPKRGIGEATVEKLRQAATLEGQSILGYCAELVMERPVKNSVRLSSKQKEALKSYVDILHNLKEISTSCSLKETVRAAIESTGYLKFLEEEKETFAERKENLNALISKAMEWESSTSEPSLAGFLEELSLKSSLDEAQGAHDRLHLMTMHNSKGLEFDVVFIVGMEEDLFPHANSRDSELAQEEERRLCYVGMTRAKEFLYLCDVRQRFLWGTTRTQRPSRFLNEVPQKFIERIRPSFYAKAETGGARSSYKSRDDFPVTEPFSDELDRSEASHQDLEAMKWVLKKTDPT